MPTSADDEPLTVAQLSAQARIAETTIRNWSRRESNPLERVPGGIQMHTWGQLLRFLEANPQLYKASMAARLRASRPVASAANVPPRSRTQVAALRAAAEAHLTAIVEAVKAAEATARLHREQLEALMGAFDEAVKTTDGSPAPRGRARRGP